jgi:uncharacterized membrane protein YfcA
MEANGKFMKKDISKGGLIGALAGSLFSTRFYKKNDGTMKNVAKTGLFASVGFLLGSFLEKSFKK